MAKKTIDRFSLRYSAFKLYVMLTHRLFYRRMQSKFRNRIPRNRPVLFAPNHQNALMDAMGPLMTSRRDPVFLARADVFKKKFIAGILRLFKILPVYRIRDGASELGKNEDIFTEAMEVLGRKKCPVAIMPEGNHGDKRKLRPLVKGIFRVAFQAQENYGENPGVVIVPIGMDYSRYSNFRGDMFIQYGEPIEVCEYYSEYKDNQPRAINSIRERLASEMRKYIIDIRSEEHYDTYMLLRQTYNRRMCKRLSFRRRDLYHRLLADQYMIKELARVEAEQGNNLSSLTEMGNEYSAGVDKLKLRDWVFEKSRYSVPGLILASLGLLALLPVFLYGAILNSFPYWLTGKISDGLKDTQFRSSFKLVLGTFLFPITYLILFIPVWLLTESWWIKWAFLISLPVIGLFSHTWYIWYKKIRSLWKYQALTMGNDKYLEKLKSLRNEINSQAESFIPDPTSIHT
ncbi:1-acyl-sn-glycerol-3-phosphate acyltransferase [Bacteroidota bacterium]